jgi:hypothetical protein
MALKSFRLAGSTYFDIGSGLLPFSITPADATSAQARAMLVADRVRGDAFNIGADPKSGSIVPGEVSRLHSLSGYLPQGWTEAHTQLRSTRGLLGALMGNSYPVVLAYGRFLHLYEQVETHLESKLDHAYGRRLGPALMVFHVQLNIHNWTVCQLDMAETECLSPPDFCQGLHMLKVQNNLMGLPTVTNVPALLALRITTRSSRSRAGAPGGITGTGSSDGGAGVESGETLGAAVGNVAICDRGAQVRNPNQDSRFVGNTPFARMVRSRSVALAITAVGSDPPQVERNCVTGKHCISCHARGQCLEFCQRAADHVPLKPAEAAAFNAWTDAAFA